MLLKPVLNSRDPPASGSQVLELQAGVTRPCSLNVLAEYVVWECTSSAGWFDVIREEGISIEKTSPKDLAVGCVT